MPTMRFENFKPAEKVNRPKFYVSAIESQMTKINIGTKIMTHYGALSYD